MCDDMVGNIDKPSCVTAQKAGRIFFHRWWLKMAKREIWPLHDGWYTTIINPNFCMRNMVQSSHLDAVDIAIS